MAKLGRRARSFTREREGEPSTEPVETAARPFKGLGAARRAIAAGLLTGALLFGCSHDFTVEGNSAVPLDLEVVTGDGSVRTRLGSASARAFLDTGTPVSALAVSAGCDPSAPPPLILSSIAAPARVRWGFPDLRPFCLPEPAPGAAEAVSVVGGDLFSQFEVVFTQNGLGPNLCPQGQTLGCMQLLPSEVEPTGRLGEDGFAVLAFRLVGGGTFLDAHQRVTSYPATRVPVLACLDYDPNAPEPDKPNAPPVTGVNATLLLATGVGPLVMSQSAHQRGWTLTASAPGPNISLPGAALPISSHAGIQISRLALVGPTITSSDVDPGPCGELFRGRCLRGAIPSLNALGPNGEVLYPTRKICNQKALGLGRDDDDDADAEPYAEIEFSPPLELTVIDDDVPYLQAARNDVRPSVADIDGFLGGQILQNFREVRIDYVGVPSDGIDNGPRVIVRCPPGSPTCRSCARRSSGVPGNQGECP